MDMAVVGTWIVHGHGNDISTVPKLELGGLEAEN